MNENEIEGAIIIIACVLGVIVFAPILLIIGKLLFSRGILVVWAITVAAVVGKQLITHYRDTV